MTRRLDYNQVAPNGIRPLAGSMAMSCRAVLPPN